MPVSTVVGSLNVNDIAINSLTKTYKGGSKKRLEPNFLNMTK